MRHFLSITDFSAKEIWQVLRLAKKYKLQLKKGKYQSQLKGKNMVMIFEKASLRTKLSFDIAMSQLGGHPIYFGVEEIGLRKRESVPDIAGVISSMADVLVARVFDHQSLEELAENSTIPVINALSDVEHPCQALADFLTIWEIKGELAGLTLAYIGDGENNIAHSLALGCAMLGVNFAYASPKGYLINPEITKRIKELLIKSGSTFFATTDPKQAIGLADVVYTDTWVSMGEEREFKKRLKAFRKYQVDQKLMSQAKKNAIFMHDMPARRGMEVTSAVIDGTQSVIFQQAENRLHAQKALIVYLLR
ncbi:MAG: ornithine carbamoyltransferase [Candidatus Daviesbacteria bacterium]|nr:ornithine carbamoyltransferase [Candidatus Daviesbacteria bacterium]